MKNRRIGTALLLAAALLLSVGATAFGQEHMPVNIKANNQPNRHRINSSVYYRDVDQENNAMVIELMKSNKDFKPFTRFYTAQEAESIRNLQYTDAVKTIASFDAGTVKDLSIKSSACGIAVEPVEGDNIIVSLCGVKDASRLDVSASVIGGTLFVSAFGKAGELYYIDPTKGARMNTILVQVPDKVLKSIVVDDTTSLILLPDMGVPITAATVNGMVKVYGTDIQTGHTLSCINGDVFLLANQIGGQQEMNTVNGDLRLAAETVDGKTKMNCVNGDIWAQVGIVTGTLHTECVNGDISIQLTKMPTNLTFTPYYRFNADVNLPQGYEKGKIFGDGKGNLNMKTVNGSLFLDMQ